ncbi:hypothetical protein SLA2020_023830 [Shorea laevis]
MDVLGGAQFWSIGKISSASLVCSVKENYCRLEIKPNFVQVIILLEGICSFNSSALAVHCMHRFDFLYMTFH